MYALIRIASHGAAIPSRRELYGVCGNRHLLEKIRAGQEHPEDWHITAAAWTIPSKYDYVLRKAG